jgi:CBS domain containing-hemolysin-like protein
MIDFIVLALGLTVTTILEFLTAAINGMSASVILALDDEGSAIGQRLRPVVVEPESARLSMNLLDVVAICTVGVAMAEAPWEWLPELTAARVGLGVLAVVVLKTGAAVVGGRYADMLLRPISMLMVVTLALTRILTVPYTMLMRLTHTESAEEEAREELEALVETAREEGALDAGEYRIMTNIMRLSSIEVSDVMTPRLVVFSLPETLTVGDAVKRPELQMYSRFPVHGGGSLDDVTGYVMTKDVLRAALAGRHAVELGKLKREVHFIPENVSLDQALEQFLQRRQHLFMVVDEYGGVEGLIAMEDVMETMLGAEIVDEADHVIDLRALAKQRRDARVAQLRQDVA